MKIVIVVDEFDPDKGYLEYYLATELARRGNLVYLLTYGNARNVHVLRRSDRFTVVEIPSLFHIGSSPLPTLAGLCYCLRLMITERPSVVHCQPIYSPLSAFFVLLRNQLGYRVVGSLLTGTFDIDSLLKRVLLSVARSFTMRQLSDKAFLLFTPTKELGFVTARLFGMTADRLCLIPMGADTELFSCDESRRRASRVDLRFETDDVVIVYSGKLVKAKGIEMLLLAVAPIARQNDKVRLLVIGKGDKSYSRYLRQLAVDLGIKDKVVFYGWVHRTALPSFFCAADVAVWPAAPSISMVEAASCGLPLVVSRSSFTKYVIEHGNGLDFEAGNVTELGRCLSTLVGDKEMRARMSKNARFLVEQSLNWNVITQQYLESYKYAIAARE